MSAYEIKHSTTEDLRATADRIRREVMAREDAARIAENRQAIGKCYRYRNCYSLPEKPSDYWWLYARVERVDEGGWPVGWSFQVDKDGMITISPLQRVHQMFGGWSEITTHEFYVEYAKVLARLKAMKSRKVRWNQISRSERVK